VNVIDIFNKNIILAHQNNYLLSYILNYLIKPVYNHTLEKAIKFNNPKNFNDLKNKIENLKILFKNNPKILNNNEKNLFEFDAENEIKVINMKKIIEESNKKKNDDLRNKKIEENESENENNSQIGELESDDDLY
jgi:hypothetical protein